MAEGSLTDPELGPGPRLGLGLGLELELELELEPVFLNPARPPPLRRLRRPMSTLLRVVAGEHKHPLASDSARQEPVPKPPNPRFCWLWWHRLWSQCRCRRPRS